MHFTYTIISTIWWSFIWLMLKLVTPKTYDPKILNNNLIKGDESTNKILENTFAFIHAVGAIIIGCLYTINNSWMHLAMGWGIGYFILSTIFQLLQFGNKMSLPYILHHIVTLITLYNIPDPILQKYIMTGYLLAEISNIPMYIAYNQVHNIDVFVKCYKKPNPESIYKQHVKPSEELLYVEVIIYTFCRILIGGYLMYDMIYTTPYFITFIGLTLYSMSIIWCSKLWNQI